MKKIEKLIEAIGGTSLMVMTIVVFLQVIARYVFKAPFSWAEELTRYLMIWGTFLGAAVLIARREHIVVDILLNVIPMRSKAVLLVIGDLILFWFLVRLVLSGMELVKVSSGIISTGLVIPMGYVSMAVPIGALLMIILLIPATISQFRIITRGKE